ncbi:MBL fold metallo-hydrolase [Natronobacterium gregoryi]|uniref:Beta-lactamase domain-containing protein n=2 Tax=Natronobacterium gregoryi TaxID=44930 RepID=L0AJH7_NATGS|nr:MBL fold metallo-hydrolase [Natronobacterium gregoryi]AFZ73195.1 Zn-dependent hydrolase, glyoxylase [Natronobacterium gregoryi SP2]ELY71347.1 beta-lactamase domain-containing protein [Natronobacterium gregoryi SP2]PLK21605.1 MBL fold metallo-hydrolase [Natronobacterium gregoryi SP2]SFI58785.1 Glyoxylase, beta-lactamase superfamily II [Natronobacterium gregoryi]
MNVYHVTADANTFTCNVFLVVGEETTLVDTGAYEGVVDSIHEHVDDVDSVVMTHQHGDHVAQLEAVADAFDPDVYAADDHPARTHALEDGDTVRIGDEAFDVVYTPGHADDHVALVSETTLFSGDVVVHDDGAFDDGSFGRTDMAGQSRERLIESIRELLDRMPDGVEHMYAGHGDIFHGDVRDVVETALERAEKRKPKYPDE